MSWATCYSGSNNIHFNIPPSMSDGRLFTNFNPSYDANEKFRNNLASLIMALFWLSPLLLVILSVQTNLKNLLLYLSYFSFYLISYYGLSKNNYYK